jgi:hypothetical protein
VPTGVEAEVEIDIVDEEVGVIGLGLKEAEEPVGNPVAESDTEELKPLTDVRFTVYVVELP